MKTREIITDHLTRKLCLAVLISGLPPQAEPGPGVGDGSPEASIALDHLLCRMNAIGAISRDEAHRLMEAHGYFARSSAEVARRLEAGEREKAQRAFEFALKQSAVLVSFLRILADRRQKILGWASDSRAGFTRSPRLHAAA